METTGFVHRLVSWSGTAFYVASALALVSVCWSHRDVASDGSVPTERDLGVGAVQSSVDENVSGLTVDAEPLFQSSQKIVPGERWPAAHLPFFLSRFLVVTMDAGISHA